MPLVRLPVLSGEIQLTLPDDWQVQERRVREAPALSEREIDRAFAEPIAVPPWDVLVRGKRQATIVVDDCFRPTPAHLLAPALVRRLLDAGLAESQIRFMLATGMHRAQTGRDLAAKLGREIVEHFEILPHNPYENLVYLGTTERGIPVWVNRWVVESDLRLGIGCVVPHSGAGFGGGGKILMPGICGIETVATHHEGIPRGGPTLDANEWRQEIETIASMIGLDLVVNAVLNGRSEIAGLFVGDMVVAQRQAADLAAQLYRVDLPTDMDIALVSGYPLDQELAQARKGVVIAARCVRPGGALVLFGDCPEGAGFHALYGAGGRFQAMTKDGLSNKLGDRQVWVCSPNVTAFDARQYLPDTTRVARDPQALIAELATQYPQAHVCVLAQGTLLIA
jgi:nickel-dependent lactate racemase